MKLVGDQIDPPSEKTTLKKPSLVRVKGIFLTSPATLYSGTLL